VRRSPALVMAIAAGLAGCSAGLVGCSDDGGGDRLASGDDFSVEAALAELPVPPDTDDQPIAATVLDLDAASDAAGLERPAAGTDGDALQEWYAALSFPGDDEDIPPIPVPPFDAFGLGRAPADTVADEIGLDLGAVDALAQVAAPPFVFGVAQGAVAADDLAGADLAERDGVFSLGSGEDLEPSPDDASAARPTGAPLRLAVEDDRLASSATTDALEGWRDGEGDRLGDDDAWSEVAAALDGDDAVGAVLMEASYDRPAGARETAEQVEATEELVPIGEPFTVVGLGFAVEDGEPAVTVAYAFADDDAAETAVDQVERAFAESVSLIDRAPISDRVDVREVEADGRVVIARLRLVDTQPTRLITMLNTRDTPFFHR
jgi:hypothetical protein